MTLLKVPRTSALFLHCSTTVTCHVLALRIAVCSITPFLSATETLPGSGVQGLTAEEAVGTS